MAHSAQSNRFFLFVFASGLIAAANGQADERLFDGHATPISASSNSMAMMQAEIDDLRHRLEMIDSANQQAYDVDTYRSLVPAWVISVDYLNWDL